MNVWPLVFSYRGVIRGAGFTARIHAVSRVLAEEQEDGSIWLNGAEPGGVAIGGDDFDSAHVKLKAMFNDIVWDTAEEAVDLDGFREAMDRFFRDVDRPVNAQWQTAWMANRQGDLDCELVEMLKRFTGQETATLLDIVPLSHPVEQSTEIVAGGDQPKPVSKAAPASDLQLAVAA